MTGGQLAKLLGVSDETVRKRGKSGDLPIAGRNARGHPLYDVAAAMAAWSNVRHEGTCGGVREGAGRPRRETHHPDDERQQTLVEQWAEQDRLADISVQLERLSGPALQIRERLAKARLAERREREARGELVLAADVAAATRELLQGLRVGVDALPASVAADLARELGVDPAVVQPIVRRACRVLVDAIPEA